MGLKRRTAMGGAELRECDFWDPGLATKSAKSRSEHQGSVGDEMYVVMQHHTIATPHCDASILWVAC